VTPTSLPRILSGDQHRIATLLFEPTGELGGRRRLAGALKASQEHDCGRLGGVVNLERLAAEGRRELLVHDFDDLLRRRQALRQLDSGASQADRFDQVLYDVQVDVSLKQRHPDLAEDLADFGVAKVSPPA
jgi:hypothetical protein